MRMLWIGLSAVVSIVAQGCGDPSVESDEQAVRSAPTTSSQGLAAPETSCVLKAQAVKPGEPLPAAPTASQVDCFATFSEAISSVTQGAVQLSATARAADFKEEDLMRAAAPTRASLPYIVGIGYADSDFGGTAYIFTSVEPCGAVFYGTLPSGWEDTISSAKAYANCNHSWHYENPHFGGAQRDCGTSCSYIGDAMNDRTSSIFWTQ